MVTNEVLEFLVRGEDCEAIDIPAGYTHSITNVGDEDMVVLFWASEIFNPERPDTYFEAV
jgi:UDP-2-acetamido-2,6-beta-L-arabino-hexul-4-ose reductase